MGRRKKKMMLGRGVGAAPVGDSFIMEITTIGASESFTFPFHDIGSYTNCTINFGDGGGAKTISTWNDANATNIYASADTYTITINADACGGMSFDNALPDLRVDDIQQWGTIQFYWINFYGCSNMIVTATDIPDFSNVTIGIKQMFRNCSSVTTIPNMNSWDVSMITDFSGFMFGATNATPDVVDWDVSASTTMSSMFRSTKFDSDIGGWIFKTGAGSVRIDAMFLSNTTMTWDLSDWDAQSSKFNNLTSTFQSNNNTSVTTYSLDGWDVSNVTNMTNTFNSCAYAGALNSWDVSSVTNMTGMFAGLTCLFNSSISNWVTSSLTNVTSMFEANDTFNHSSLNSLDVSGVTTFTNCFLNNKEFNQSLSSWDVSAGTVFFGMFRGALHTFNQPLPWTFKASGTIDMRSMFRDNPVFDQDLSGWNVSQVNQLDDFFLNETMSTANYDALLIGWEAQSLTSGVTADFGNSTYTLGGAAETAHDDLEAAPNNWTITDGGGV